MPSVREAAKRYAKLGISVIPVKPDKSPVGGWKFAQQGIAQAKDIESWYAASPTAGVAVVCGRVSGNLAVLDVDHRVLSDFMREKLWPVLAKTWIVETGSGKIHVYVRSKGTVYTSVLKSSDGAKLAEVRSDGRPPFEASYVVAPPSPYDFKGVKGYYKTLAGGPESIVQVADAGDWLRSMVMGAYAKIPGSSSSAVISSVQEPNIASTEIMAPGDTEEMARLVKDLRLSGKVVRAIFGAAVPRVGEWWSCPSNSEVDHYVMAALREAGVDHEVVERIFATFPIGEACYRNGKRPNHGRRYILGDLVKIDAKIQDRRDAATRAEGKNFTVTRVVRLESEEPSYELYITRLDTGESGVVKMTASQLMSERMFKVAVLAGMNFVAEMKDEQEKHFNLFVTAVAAMSTIEETPQDATTAGFLGGVIFQVLRDEASSSPPESYKDSTLGWKDDRDGVVVVIGRALVQRVGQIIRPSPKPDEIWAVLRSVGSREGTESGMPVWKVPLTQVEARS